MDSILFKVQKMFQKLRKKFKSSRALLFDMDGVITDSMPRHCRSWLRAFRDIFGLKIPPIEIYKREGEKSDKSVKEILSGYHISVTDTQLNDFLDHKASLFNGQGKIRYFSGMRTFLKKLSKQKSLGLVTGTQRREIDAMFEDRFKSQFQTIVTSTDVQRGKPHPEPYQKALVRLGISPDEALVIENAPYGIRSAHAAGIQVLALPTSLPKEALTEADYICTHEEMYRLME